MADLNISRVTLARELGVDRSVIARWLAGVNQPTGHNLTRLTDIVRRHRPGVTLEFWQQAESAAAASREPEPVAPPPSGLHLSGLTLARRPENEANYTGLWAGFYQSTQNRGAVILCAMHIRPEETGLAAVFTEGKVSAKGTVVAIGPRLHAILEIDPLHDRLCLFIFNGVGSSDAMVMDGIYMISAGDTSTCVAASPIVLFRVGEVGEFDRGGGLTGVMQSLYQVNKHNVQDAVLAGDPVAGLIDIAPEPVLRLMCPQTGIPRADGEFDHVLRMPASRTLPGGNFGLAELPLNSPIVTTRNALRRVLRLDGAASRMHEPAERAAG